MPLSISLRPSMTSPSPTCARHLHFTSRKAPRPTSVRAGKAPSPIPSFASNMRGKCLRPRPLALFDGPRTDFSLARLRHYTGTPPEHFQQFVLFTNYVRYVDEFVGVAIDTLRRNDSRFTALSVPGALYERGELADAEAQI